ncbi:hypothetical protein ACHAWU_003689 [Discostella pseudostelligera]|uniref:Peripheral subunit-binding (PSBD) domain-containing protein n=1 Tax=Discostella pseudostelligera TaxID=259834 RepID=A0ABD3N5W5_9STRA
MTVFAGIAISILHLALLRDGATAFLVAPLPSTTTTSSFSSSALAATSSPNDPYATLIDAISHAADAAYSAAQHSEQLASSIGGDVLLASSASLSPSAQAGLSILEKNIATSSDPTILMQAIHAALDSSIHAAEMAASSTTVLVHNLANFDEALATSMALANNHNPHFHTMMLSPEYADVAQAKLALLLHNLSGLAIEDNFLTNFLSEMDRQLDALLPSSSASSGAISVSTSNMILYGTVAAVLAYSQRQAGIEGYKMELRTLLERGELDMTMLAQDVGLNVEANAEVTLEDPAQAMAVVVESAAAAAAAAATAVIVADEKPVTADRSVEVVVPLTPKPPTADVPLDTLMNAVATATIEDIAPEIVAAIAPTPIKPQKVGVVKVPKKKGPMASPLARLFAEELGIDLTNLGRGSGKDGKILIDDVRNFQSRLEAAKKSMTSNMGRAYFATAST